MFGAGAPLMGAGGQGFDPRRMMGGPQAGNTPGQNPFGRGSSGGADQFGIGVGPGGGPGGSAMASGGAPPWAQGPPGMGPGGAGPGGPAPPMGGFPGGPMGPGGGGSPYQAQMGQGMAGGNMGPGGSGGIFAGGPQPGQLGMNVQGGNMGPKPMSPIGAGAYGQAGGNMLGQMDQSGRPARDPMAPPVAPDIPNVRGLGPQGGNGYGMGPDGKPATGPDPLVRMQNRLKAAGMPDDQIGRRLQMAQQGKLPWQQAQGGQGAGGRETNAFNSQNNTDGGHTGTPLSPPSQGHPPGGLRQPPGRPAPPPTRGTNSGLNTQGSNPFGRGSSGGAGAFAVDDGSNGGGPSSAGEAGSTSRLDVIGGRGAAVRPRNPGPGGGGPAPPRGGIADGRPTPRPMKPGISAPGGMFGGMFGGMKPGATGVSGGDFKDTRPAGVETKPQGTGGVWGQPSHTMGGQAKRQSVAGKAFGKLKA